EYLLWADTLSSLRRLGIGLLVSAVIALVVAVATGSFPVVSATLSPFVTVISMVPPLAVLPILFIVFGLDELSKVVLIVVGITPMI
ncbi:ABC transporter permease, partial [Halomonas sp. SIMBA_159]